MSIGALLAAVRALVMRRRDEDGFSAAETFHFPTGNEFLPLVAAPITTVRAATCLKWFAAHLANRVIVRAVSARHEPRLGIG